jgi:hypothetical protein
MSFCEGAEELKLSNDVAGASTTQNKQFCEGTEEDQSEKNIFERREVK